MGTEWGPNGNGWDSNLAIRFGEIFWEFWWGEVT